MKMTQADRIVDYINRFGSITPMQAFRDLGVTKLATRISEMRQEGVRFDQEWQTSKNRFGEEVRYMKYWLAD